MHRATQVDSLQRGANSGGARMTLDSIDDSKQMQEVGGNFMKGESRTKIERPQNYGFSCVPHDPDKDANGNITGCAEGFVNFMGGNRSFPVLGMLDDRRHRLKGQKAGDVALYRGRDDAQQFDLIAAGNFLSAAVGKINRIALVPKPGGGQQQEGAQARGVTGEGGSETGSGGQQQKEMGQKPVFGDNQNSKTFFEQSESATTMQQEDKKSVRVSKKRAYMRFGDFALWIDDQGIHSTHPITIAALPKDDE